MEEDGLHFVHLSDIHFRKPKADAQSIQDADLRNELERDLGGFVARNARIKWDGILVSGDIAFSGNEQEYHVARKWLVALSSIIRAEPESVWVVPGNHDINWKAIEDSPILGQIQGAIRTARPEEVDRLITKYLIDEKTNPDLLFGPLKAYLAFASAYSCHHLPNEPTWTDDLRLNDNSILRIVGINSTLVSHANDNDGANKLVVGQAQLSFPRQAGVEYLALCHHPPQWLKDQDFVEDVFLQRVRVQLFGHKHRQRCKEIDRKSVKLVAGATQPDRREPNWKPVYNLLQLRVLRKAGDRFLEVKVEPRVWNDADMTFVADSGVEGPIKTYELALDPYESTEDQPRTNSTPSSEPPEAPKSSSMNLRQLTYRFLTLPYTKQVEVAQQLGLIEEDDKGKQDQELFQLFFSRARERKLVEELAKAIEKARGRA